MSFPRGIVIKNLPAKTGQARDVGLTPGSGRSPGVGNGNPFQDSCLENSMDRGTWWATVHEATESDTTEWLSTHITIYIQIYNSIEGDEFTILLDGNNNPRPASVPLYKATGVWGWGERFSTKLNPKLLGLIKMSISWCHLYLFFAFHLKYGHSFSGSIWFPLPHLSVWEWVFLHQLKNILGLCLQQFKMHSSSTESIFQLYI